MSFLKFNEMLKLKPMYEMLPGHPALRIEDSVLLFLDSVIVKCKFLGYQRVDGVLIAMIYSPVPIQSENGRFNVLSIDGSIIEWHEPGQWHIYLDSEPLNPTGEINW